jgi:glycerol-3-phosphate acyltransferase PlsY
MNRGFPFLVFLVFVFAIIAHIYVIFVLFNEPPMTTYLPDHHESIICGEQ